MVLVGFPYFSRTLAPWHHAMEPARLRLWRSRFRSQYAVAWGVIAGHFAGSGAATSGEALWRAIVVGVVVTIIVTPVCLGMGYMWGIWMAYFTGLERDDTSAHSSPTPNNRDRKSVV